MDEENAQDDQKMMGDFIAKEKAEVYLLMDFLSGRADKKIRDEKISMPERQVPPQPGTPTPPERLIEFSLIDSVCAVRWPPALLADQKSSAETASVLLKARDRLSEIAFPASGASIAFTTFVTNNMSQTTGWPWQSAKEESAYTKEYFSQRAIVSNARIAYPDYEALAQNFNLRRRNLGLLLPLFLVLAVAGSFWCSYEITPAPNTGTTAQPTPAAPVPPATPPVQKQPTPAPTPATPQSTSGKDDQSPAPAPAPSDTITPSAAPAPTAPTPATTVQTAPAPPAPTTPPFDPRFVITFRDQGLPVLYGLVGAIAGVMRNIQVKLRDGLLMPRDRMHIVIQLSLGAVMGATIGLFQGVATNTTASPQLQFSASALSFIAGLGVDSVFLWLENLIRTIFGGKPAT